jgi:putative ABC transport system permease protein
VNHARLLRHSARLVLRHRVRSAFVAVASGLGVAVLTLVVSVGGAASRRLLTTVQQIFGASSVVVMAGGTQLLGGPHGDTARLTVDDIDAVVGGVPGIATWDVQQALPGATVRHGDRSARARVLGQSERSREAWQRDVSRGAYFDRQAVDRSDRVALIGETLARRLFGEDDPIGADVRIGSVSFQVIGVLQRFGTDIHGMDRDNELVVPVSTLQRRVMNVDTIVQAKLVVADPGQVHRVAAAVTAALRARHAIPAGRPDDFALITADDIRQMVGTVQQVLFLYLPLVAGIGLVVAGIAAATLMLAAVSARSGEIGLRRAVGAEPADIWLQFVAETAITIVAGGAGGVLLGIAGSWAAAVHLHLGSAVSWPAVALGLGVSLVVGILAGVLPARRAAQLPPARALR